MSAKAKSKLTPEQRNATLRRVLEKIRPYGFFVVCSNMGAQPGRDEFLPCE